MKKQSASEAEIKKLYDPETFYEHGDNPALKKFMEIMTENVQQGRLIDYRTYHVNNYTKMFFARNWEDFVQQDLKMYTFPRALIGFAYMTGIWALSMRYARNFLPVGSHGITSVTQTQAYHLYGPLGVTAIMAFPLATTYLWYKTAKFTAKKFYYHVLLGERVWLYEQEKQNPSVGEYYFNDSPWSSDEAFPDLARGEMSKKEREKPEWAA